MRVEHAGIDERDIGDREEVQPLGPQDLGEVTTERIGRVADDQEIGVQDVFAPVVFEGPAVGLEHLAARGLDQLASDDLVVRLVLPLHEHVGKDPFEGFQWRVLVEDGDGVDAVERRE